MCGERAQSEGIPGSQNVLCWGLGVRLYAEDEGVVENEAWEVSRTHLALGLESPFERHWDFMLGVVHPATGASVILRALCGAAGQSTEPTSR